MSNLTNIPGGDNLPDRFGNVGEQKKLMGIEKSLFSVMGLT